MNPFEIISSKNIVKRNNCNNNGVTIYGEFNNLIENILSEKIKNDDIYKQKFSNPILNQFNKDNKNPYSLDKFLIPIRLSEKDKRNNYGWTLNEFGEVVNINVDTRDLTISEIGLDSDAIKSFTDRMIKNTKDKTKTSGKTKISKAKISKSKKKKNPDEPVFVNEVFEKTYEKIIKLYPKLCTPRSTFMRIINAVRNFVDDFRNAEINEENIDNPEDNIDSNLDNNLDNNLDEHNFNENNQDEQNTEESYLEQELNQKIKNLDEENLDENNFDIDDDEEDSDREIDEENIADDLI